VITALFIFWKFILRILLNLPIYKYKIVSGGFIMGMNMPIGSAGGVDRIPAVVATPQVRQEPTKDTSIPSVKFNVQSTKEVKQAENEGQTFTIGEEQLVKAIERANKAMQGINTSFEFSIHEGTKEIMVKVIDKDTGEVVREIPSEKVLDMVAKMWEMSGIFVDERR
jgi:flagellar protein FlaG